MRNVEDMHWFLWEAIVMQAQDMYSKGLLAESLMADVNFITTAVKTRGVFSDRMKIMACGIEALMLKKESEWQCMIEAEQEEMYAAQVR